MNNAQSDPSTRFPAIAREKMSDAQRQAYDALVAGPRGGARGPFNALLRSPDLMDKVQRVGEYVRFRTSIPARLNELAILVTGRAWGAKFEFYAHRILALKAGLSESIADAIARNERPKGMQPDEELVYDFATALHRDHVIDDALFKRAVAAGATVPPGPMGELADQFWGDRCGAVTDPEGYTWTIATRKEDLTPEEINQRAQEFFKNFAGSQK